MVKIKFTNAEVHDYGYGLQINNESLEDIITKALGANHERFQANACDVTVLIEPHPQNVTIEDDGKMYCSLAELEAVFNGRNNEENTEAESES